MHTRNFIAGGLAFWLGEMAEHFLPGGVVTGVLVGGVVAVGICWAWSVLRRSA